ncbi:hypothetical protein ACFLS1_08760, partial [Verrucomicrobiota bacterium]
GLEMGPFSYFPDWKREKAEACHVLNKEMLIELLETTDAPVAAFSEWGFAISSPAITKLSDKDQRELKAVLKKRYVLFREIDDFGHAGTKLQIFLKAEI